MRPARRVRRALPLPNSVRVSASRRKSAMVCAPQEVDRSAHRRTGAAHLEGRRTSITESEDSLAGLNKRICDEPRETRIGPSEREPGGFPEAGRAPPREA